MKWGRFVVCLAAILMASGTLAAPPRLQEFDARGYGVRGGNVSALRVSRQQAIVLKVNGEIEDRIALARGTLKRLVATGYYRVVLIRADGDHDMMQVYSEGYPYADITNVRATISTEAAIREAVIGAYDKAGLAKRDIRAKAQESDRDHSS